MKTIAIALQTPDALLILSEFDRSSLSTDLVRDGPRRTSSMPYVYSMREDGQDTPHTIELHVDGTWTMKTDVLTCISGVPE